MGKVVMVAGRGGSGKTTVSANLSYAFWKLNKNVLVVDCDFGMRCTDLIFGVENEIVYNINDVLQKNCSFDDAVIKINDRLSFISAPQNITFDMADYNLFNSFLTEKKQQYDYIILDLTASITDFLSKFIKFADQLLIVGVCDYQNARVVEKLAFYGEKANIKNINLIINKVFVDKFKKNGIIDINEFIGLTAVTPIGVCPYDVVVTKGSIVVDDKKSICGKAFSNIARRIDGEKVPLLNI